MRCLVSLAACVVLVGGAPLPAVEKQEAQWPQFHKNSARDALSTETGLLKKWPKDGPALLWKYSDCGVGYAGQAIAEGKIFSAGDFDDQEMLFALDLNGKLLWKTPNGAAWQSSTPGSRTTPTYNEGVLYHLNPTGRLAAVNAPDGKPLWSVDLKKEFGARFGTWAMAENLIVDGDYVLCLPGGTKGFAVALDRRTGKTAWVNTDIDERAAYCSPILAKWKGKRLLITLSQQSAVCFDVADGKLLWSKPSGRVWQNTTPPVFHDGYVFVTCGHSGGGTLLKINDDLKGVTQVWHRDDFDNCHGGVLLVDGCLYGSGCRLGGKAFFCIDFMTGETKSLDKTLGKLSITYADGMLYCVDDKRKMLLLAVKPGGFEQVSQFRLPKGSEELTLCHLVICGGRLYARHDNVMYVFDIRGK